MQVPARYAALLAAAMIGGLPVAHAQSSPGQSPSAQQIINALKPSGTLSNTTRGIRPLPPGPAETANPGAISNGAISNTMPAVGTGSRTAASAQIKAVTKQPAINLNVDFANGSAELTPGARQSLDQLGQALTSKTLAQYRFKIVGHTDTMGGAAANQALSDARAKAVKAYLQGKYDVPASRLKATGVGESGLLVPTPPQTANAANRRVQVINLGH